MDMDLARRQFEASLGENGEVVKPERVLTPLGYSQSIQLQMSILESIRLLDNTLRRVNGNKAAPPRPLERPVTAFELIEKEHDRNYVNNALKRLGVKGI